MKKIIMALFTMFALFTLLPAFAGEKAGAGKGGSCCASVSNCKDCAKMCEDMLAYCQKKGGKHASAEHIKTLEDCIALCKACTDFESRESTLAPKLHQVCAEACDKCAKSCADLKDKKLDDCVAQCKKCATSCKDSGK